MTWSSVKLHFDKLIAVVLAAQGLYGVYTSLLFMFVDLPQLEQQLAVHQVSPVEVATLINQAFITVILTIISAILSIKIFRSTSPFLLTILGLLVVISNSFLNQLLNQLGAAQVFTESITTFLLTR